MQHLLQFQREKGKEEKERARQRKRERERVGKKGREQHSQPGIGTVKTIDSSKSPNPIIKCETFEWSASTSSASTDGIAKHSRKLYRKVTETYLVNNGGFIGKVVDTLRNKRKNERKRRKACFRLGLNQALYAWHLSIKTPHSDGLLLLSANLISLSAVPV